jgi:hypothetical protein
MPSKYMFRKKPTPKIEELKPKKVIRKPKKWN